MSEQPADLSAVEDAGVAFDPTSQYLDLTKEEKRRTTALMLAIQAYKELIIKEASYLREAADLARRDEGPKLQPATIDAMVFAAIKFDDFISGKTEEARAHEPDPKEEENPKSDWDADQSGGEKVKNKERHSGPTIY